MATASCAVGMNSVDHLLPACSTFCSASPGRLAYTLSLAMPDALMHAELAHRQDLSQTLSQSSCAPGAPLPLPHHGPVDVAKRASQDRGGSGNQPLRRWWLSGRAASSPALLRHDVATIATTIAPAPTTARSVGASAVASPPAANASATATAASAATATAAPPPPPPPPPSPLLRGRNPRRHPTHHPSATTIAATAASTTSTAPRSALYLGEVLAVAPVTRLSLATIRSASESLADDKWQLKATLSSRLDCQPPQCLVTLREVEGTAANRRLLREDDIAIPVAHRWRARLLAGGKDALSYNVSIDVIMTIPEHEGGDASAAEAQAERLLRQDKESLSQELRVDVVERDDAPRVLHRVMVPLIVAAPPPEASYPLYPASLNDRQTIVYSSAAFKAAVIAVIVLVVFLVLGFAAACVVINRRMQIEPMKSQLLSPSGGGKSRRLTISEMQLQPDGTAGTTQLVVHEDRESRHWDHGSQHADRKSQLLSASDGGKSRRLTVSEMKLQPDGTVGGGHLVVHEDRGSESAMWSKI